jgi:hypothetical protein
MKEQDARVTASRKRLALAKEKRFEQCYERLEVGGPGVCVAPASPRPLPPYPLPAHLPRPPSPAIRSCLSVLDINSRRVAR